MASRTTTRPLQSILRRARPSCECAKVQSTRRQCIRQISATATRPGAKGETEPDQRPRWSYTPENMKAPYPWRKKDPDQTVFVCNSDPKRLDRFYNNFLGPGGDQILTDEVKWLAVTHKSFDQGRRGFNDRLAFFGRRILNMQTNIALTQSVIGTATQSPTDPNDDRVPSTDPKLEGLANLADMPLGTVLTKERLATLATSFGMREVMRWQPRNADRLATSGIDVVLNTGVYAIIGALALQKGGAYASEVAREKVLKPLGII